MQKRLAVLLFFLMPALLSASPAPNDSPKKHFHPATKGTKWVYKNGKVRFAYRINEIENVGDATIIHVVSEEANDKTSPNETLSLNNKGIFRIRTGTEKLDPPVCLLKLPVQVGAEWSGPLDDFVLVDTSKIVKIEEITVPAGKYKTIRVELDLQFKDVFKTDTHPPTLWYAEGVGLVKYHIGESTSELVEFIPAK